MAEVTVTTLAEDGVTVVATTTIEVPDPEPTPEDRIAELEAIIAALLGES